MSETTAATDPGPLTAARASRGVLAPGPLLRLEGLALLATAVVVYGQLDASWWLFAGLLLVPDVGLAGYLAGPRVGAATYNLTHTVVLPLALGAWALAAGTSTALAVAVIWLAHLGMDRAVGYGLKYRTAAADTHLQRVA
ncbi:DUF4260 domain-containing protein [Nitriliruptor alkaliphilus]|uniref:DUF4260 domain-containing protein n=1 Tax=Nitriliruptor alkaliphilus TaxID=427918 RepID=UPI0009FA151E|nr:DUF4260 domain-containing protein [Nitriliruptor alkaliphilus]